MRVFRPALIAAFVAGCAASAAAGPAFRPFGPPALHPWIAPPAFFHHGRGGDHHDWRFGQAEFRHDGDRDFRRHRGGPQFFAPFAVGAPVEAAPEAAAPPLVVAAPITINLTVAQGDAAPPVWAPQPKLIALPGDPPPRRPLPLVVYGQ